jgi:hypothetical protein
MKSRWITHKGKRVFVFDCSHFGSDTAALEAEIKQVAEVVTKEPLDSALNVTNSEGTIGTPANLRVLERLMSITSRHTRRRAVVGVTGVRRFLVDTINRVSRSRPLTIFETMEEGLDWLVK